ncbi:MAG: hypothetical protein ACJ790_23210 [Myxococcaceae bacterium]
MKAISTLPARGLVLAFFHAASDRALDVGTLVAATRALGLTGNSTRVTLSRLLSEGWLLRDERGRYRLKSERAAAAAGLVPFKELNHSVRAWKGGWLGCLFEVQGRGADVPDGLRRLGFREVSPGFAIRPDNLRGGTSLLNSRVGSARLLSVDATGEGDATAHWPTLWAPSALTKDYLRMRQLIQTSRVKLSKLGPEAQLAETFDVARACIARLEQDPLLPDQWVGGRMRETLVDELVSYDRDARELWMQVIPGLELEGSLRAGAGWSPGAKR